MITERGDLLLIPFGTSGFHHQNFELAGFSPDGLRLWSATPCVLINRAAGDPLRLNSIAVPAATAHPRGRLAEVEGELGLLEAHLQRLCGEWARPPRRFLERYFEEIRLEIERNRQTLEERALPFAGLYQVEHWTFSALLPLPRAHLHLPASASASFDPADVVRVDFAFWTGAELVAVVLDGRRSLTPAGRRGRERLGTWGIEVRACDAGRLEGAPRGGLLAFLGPAFAGFWKSQRLPSGPPKGPGLAPPVPPR